MQMKRLLPLVLAAVLLVGSTAAAASDFNGFPIIHVQINGQTLQTDVPAVNFFGRTMLPVRALAEALGASVSWDAATQTVSITPATGTNNTAGNTGNDAMQTENTQLKSQVAALQSQVDTLNAKLAAIESAGKTPDKAPAPQTDIGFARSTPAPVGTTVSFQGSNYEEKYTAKLTMTQVIRGEEAWRRIYARNQFNTAPTAGMEYILAKFKFELLTMDDPSAYHSISDYDFTAVSGDGQDYDHVSVVEPEPDYDSKLYQGASHEGWVAVLVRKDDPTPVVTSGRDSRGRGGLWFNVNASSVSTSGQSNTPTGTQPQQSTGPGVADTTPEPQLPAGLSFASVTDFTNYMNSHYSTLNTAAGTLTLTYDVLTNDRTYLPFDKWVQIKYRPDLYFVDLQTKVSISPQDRLTAAAQLRAHAKLVYRIAEKAFPGQKLLGQYYDSWYKYPTIHEGFESRSYFTLQNYTVDKSNPLDLYTTAKLVPMFWNPALDDATF